MQTQLTIPPRQSQPIEFTRIEDLKKLAVGYYESTIKLARSSVQGAWETGKLLAKIKVRLSHGEWEPWLESAGIPSQTASKWMRLFQIPLGRDFDSISSALRWQRSQKALKAKSEAQIPGLTKSDKQLVELDQLKDESTRLKEELSTERDHREEAEQVATHFEKRSKAEEGYAKDRSVIAAERQRTRQSKITIGELQDTVKDLMRENTGLKRYVKRLQARISGLENALDSERKREMEGLNDPGILRT